MSLLSDYTYLEKATVGRRRVQVHGKYQTHRSKYQTVPD